MNKNNYKHNRRTSRGITLIEILVVLGVLTILLSFAIPSGSSAATRAELSVATENIQHSLDAARNMARMTETSISVNVPEALDGSTQSITFSRVTRGVSTPVSEMQELTLPADLVLLAEHDVFHYDTRGLVVNPGQLLLVSRQDDSIKSAIDVR